MKIYMVHSDYPFAMEPRVSVKIRDGLLEGEPIGTPNISYKDLGMDDSYVKGHRYEIFDKKHLWERFVDEYKSNLRKAKEMHELFELPTDEYGYVKDFSWLDGEAVQIGGCFLDGCVHNAIRSIQMELAKRERFPEVTVVPEVTLCYDQPSQVTFMEEVNGMNSIDFFFPGYDSALFKNRIKTASLKFNEV